MSDVFHMRAPVVERIISLERLQSSETVLNFVEEMILFILAITEVYTAEIGVLQNSRKSNVVHSKSIIMQGAMYHQHFKNSKSKFLKILNLTSLKWRKLHYVSWTWTPPVEP